MRSAFCKSVNPKLELQQRRLAASLDTLRAEVADAEQDLTHLLSKTHAGSWLDGGHAAACARRVEDLAAAQLEAAEAETSLAAAEDASTVLGLDRSLAISAVCIGGRRLPKRPRVNGPSRCSDDTSSSRAIECSAAGRLLFYPRARCSS